MDYELAKELKDAGFPFEFTHDPNSLSMRKYPTLSELIEACGDIGSKYFQLGYVVSGGGSWLASKDYMHGEGKTPEIAVAKLWLAIHSPATKDSKDMID